MKLKKETGNYVVRDCLSYGPTFGGGHTTSYVNGSSINLDFGHTYEYGPSRQLTRNNWVYALFTITEVEVFQVTGESPRTLNILRNEKPAHPQMLEEKTVKRLLEDVNKVINSKQEPRLIF